MKIGSQIAMVLNLDKCIGCHTCSVTCKKTWTSREGMEYGWFNNVETRPGLGYPREWENQERWKGGWKRLDNGAIVPGIGTRARVLSKIFANPDLPEIDDYYEPFDFDYGRLHEAPESDHQPIARPRSSITGRTMEKIMAGPNWDDSLGGEFEKRSRDRNLDNTQKEILGEFENTFMISLPRLCHHCLNPACVATCPSGAIYKRKEDGVVLIDQERCRGWRMCISGCPYKKIYYNWKSGKSEKCIFCYPRTESGMTTLCSESCTGRLRYLGVLLYDKDEIQRIASIPSESDIYEKQIGIFLNPHDSEIIKAAGQCGISDYTIEIAQKSPVYKFIVQWKLAFPLHPEYRTLPMVWYVPPLSPIRSNFEESGKSTNSVIPDVESLRIPVKYLANMFTFGEEAPVKSALKRMLAMRAYKRSENVEGFKNKAFPEETGLTEQEAEEMYRYMAIADYEDRFVI